MLFAILTLITEGGHFKGKKLAVYNVSGEIDPNATGNYFYDGSYNGKPSYSNFLEGIMLFYIGWDNVSRWYISPIKGASAGYNWYRISPDILGLYTHGGTALGDATVAAGLQ